MQFAAITGWSDFREPAAVAGGVRGTPHVRCLWARAGYRRRESAGQHVNGDRDPVGDAVEHNGPVSAAVDDGAEFLLRGVTGDPDGHPDPFETVAVVRVQSHGAAHIQVPSTVDLNTIPLAAIERVEVLKDGGSAIYGSDAVGGVWWLWRMQHEGGYHLFGATHHVLTGAPFGWDEANGLNLQWLLPYYPAYLATKVVGEVAAFNLVLLSGYVLSGAAMYALSRYLGCGRLVASWAAMVMGIVSTRP